MIIILYVYMQYRHIKIIIITHRHLKWDVSLLLTGKHSALLYMACQNAFDWAGWVHLSTVTQAAVLAGRDLEFCVWHWKINGLIHKQTHRCMHELLLKAAQRQAASTGSNPPLQRFTGATRGKEWEVLVSASLSRSCFISSDLLGSPAVSSGGGSWRRTVIKHKELNRKHKQMCAQANKQAHVIKTAVCALETTFLCCLFAKFVDFTIVLKNYFRQARSQNSSTC